MNWQDRRNPHAGGAEVHLHETFGRLAARGHRVSLLVSGWPGAPGRERVDGMDVHRAGGRYSFPLHVRRAYGRLAGRPFDLVVEDINKLPLYTPLWVDAPVVALVPHLFGATAFRQERWLVAAAVWGAERLMPRVYRTTPIHAISRSTADDLAERGFSPSRIRVIEPGLDHGRYRPDRDRGEFPDPVFVYVGRLQRYKGLDVMLRALRRLRDRGAVARLFVAGRGGDRERLERVAGRAGVSGQVTFGGYIAEERKVELLSRAWVNLYPSPKEGWGLTVVEAAACGTPTVASDSPGLRESVRDGETGFLVPHGDAEAWAERLLLLCSDPALRGRLGEGARRHAQRFSWDRTAERTERALAEFEITV